MHTHLLTPVLRISLGVLKPPKAGAGRPPVVAVSPLVVGRLMTGACAFAR